MVSSSAISHFTFTQLNKELHYCHGDSRTHLQRLSPLLEVLRQRLQWTDSGCFLLETQKIIFEFTAVESV